MWNLGNNRGPYWGQSQTVSVDASVESRQTITFTLACRRRNASISEKAYNLIHFASLSRIVCGASKK